MFTRLGQGQIIDVTKNCKFQWYQEPKSCYAYLQVSSASGDFTEGETVTGQNSGATATVFSSYVDGGRVYVANVSGTFEANETIEGSESKQTATVDGFVPERSYTSTPNNITHGTFPDSIISKDLNDYLEWESTLPGSGNVAKLDIFPPTSGIYSMTFFFYCGQKIDMNIATRCFRWRTGYTLSPYYTVAQIYSSSFNMNLGTAHCPAFVY